MSDAELLRDDFLIYGSCFWRVVDGEKVRIDPRHILVREPSWILLTSAQPDFDLFVLVSDGNEVGWAQLDHVDKEGPHFLCEDGQEFTGVTHWTPRPTRPSLRP